jgi:hypothetical protein
VGAPPLTGSSTAAGALPNRGFSPHVLRSGIALANSNHEDVLPDDNQQTINTMTFDIHDNDDSDYEPENDIGTDLDTSSSSNSTDPDSDDDNQFIQDEDDTRQSANNRASNEMALIIFNKANAGRRFNNGLIRSSMVDTLNKRDDMLKAYADIYASEEWTAFKVTEKLRRIDMVSEAGVESHKWVLHRHTGLPVWMDRSFARSSTTGAPTSETSRQKEILAMRGALVCSNCELKAGEILQPSGMHCTTRYFTFDGIVNEHGKIPHKLRKYKGKAPRGLVQASLELAARDACILCVFCMARKGPHVSTPVFDDEE